LGDFFQNCPVTLLKALNEQELEWPTKEDDFFPYASGNTDFDFISSLKTTQVGFSNLGANSEPSG
jgi:hypothetical protein